MSGSVKRTKGFVISQLLLGLSVNGVKETPMCLPGRLVGDSKNCCASKVEEIMRESMRVTPIHNGELLRHTSSRFATEL